MWWRSFLFIVVIDFVFTGAGMTDELELSYGGFVVLFNIGIGATDAALAETFSIMREIAVIL